MKTRTIYIASGITIVVGTGIIILVRRNNNKKLIAQINKIIDSGTQATGTPKDIAADDAFNPNFFKTIANAKIYNTASADAIAKRIYGDIGYVYDDETDIVSTIKSIPTKAKLSFVASRFLILYGESLGGFVTNHVDKGDNLTQIYNIVKTMPSN